jgi:hypothetical protein
MKRIVGNVIAALLGGAITLFILNLIVAGCSKKSPSHALEVARETQVEFVEKNDSWNVYVRIVEIDGHRFAVSSSWRSTAICEVTAASLVKTNQATISSEYSQTLFDLGFVMGAQHERDGKLGTAFSLSSERSNAWLQVVARVSGTNVEAYR